MTMSLLPKPLYGDPCNNCGICCLLSRCPISMAIFGDSDEVCPALEPVGVGFTCGLVAELADADKWGGTALSEAFALMTGAGLGCDAVHSDADAARRTAIRDEVIGRIRDAIAKASPEAQRLIAYFQGRAAA